MSKIAKRIVSYDYAEPIFEFLESNKIRSQQN